MTNETTKIELEEVPTCSTEPQATVQASGHLLGTQNGPTVGWSEGAQDDRARDHTEDKGGRKRRARLYRAVCLSALCIGICVLIIAISLSIRNILSNRGGNTISTTTLSSGNTIGISLSITFPGMTFTDALSDSSSPKYREVEQNFTQIMNTIFQTGTFANVYTETTVESVRRGSVIVGCLLRLSGLPDSLEEHLASRDLSDIESLVGDAVQNEIVRSRRFDTNVIVAVLGVTIHISSPSLPSTTPGPAATFPVDVESSCYTCEMSETCLPQSWVCDGDLDCDGGEDELNCACDEGFQCDSGLCVSVDYRCDGSPDCDEGEDEKNCTCDDRTEFQCLFNGACIQKDTLCDFSPDCVFHEDETENECNFMLMSNTINLTIGQTYSVTFPVPLQKGVYSGPGAFSLWLFHSPVDPADLLVNVDVDIQSDATSGSYVKFGRGLNATRTPIAAFYKDYATSPFNLNPFYSRSPLLWAVVYENDGEIVRGSFSVTAVSAPACIAGGEACHYSPECIPPGGRCDGNQDCTFTGEDETLCISPLSPNRLANMTNFESSSSESSFFDY